MKQYIYIREKNTVLESEFAEGKAYGNVKLGKTALFWRKMLKWYVMEFENIQRIYRRVEFVYRKMCGGGDSFEIQRLVLVLKSGEELEVWIGDRMEKQALALMEALQDSHPEIQYGTENVN